MDRIERTWKVNGTRAWGASTVALIAGLSCVASAGQVYFNNFDAAPVLSSGVTGGLSGVTTTAGVQGYAGIGTGTNTFSGQMLYSTVGGASWTTLTLANLPSHTHVSVGFLLAIIETWDGPGDFFQVEVDGVSHINHTFTNIPGLSQSYNDPGFGNLTWPNTSSPSTPLPQTLVTPYTVGGVGATAPGGFGNYFSTGGGFFGGGYHDSAYNMGLDARLQSIPHIADTLTIRIGAYGSNWFGAPDETWGIDNLTITLEGMNIIPLPGAGLMATAGLGILAAARRRR